MNLGFSGNITSFGDFTGAEEGIFTDVERIDDEMIIVYYSNGSIHIINETNEIINFIEIFSMQGNKTDQKLFRKRSGFFPVSLRSKGVYIVSLITDDRIINKKIIINN